MTQFEMQKKISKCGANLALHISRWWWGKSWRSRMCSSAQLRPRWELEVEQVIVATRRSPAHITSPQIHSHYLWDSHGGQSLWEINCIPLKTFNGNPFSDKQFHFIWDKGRPQYVQKTMPSEVSSVQFQDPWRDLTEFPLSTSFTRGEEIYLNLSTIFAVKFSSTPCW